MQSISSEAVVHNCIHLGSVWLCHKDVLSGNVQVESKHAWSDGACHKQPVPSEAGAAPPRIPRDSMGTHAGQGCDEDLHNASVHQ